MMVFFFFFKQKTAYEMRISDWSSDVCSSDLDVEVTSPTPQTVTVEVIGDLPEGAVFDSATMQLRWTPENDQAGTYQFRFRAIDSADPDNVLITEIEVPVTVFNQNRRPVVQAIQNVNVRSEEHTSEIQSIMRLSYA